MSKSKSKEQSEAMKEESKQKPWYSVGFGSETENGTEQDTEKGTENDTDSDSVSSGSRGATTKKTFESGSEPNERDVESARGDGSDGEESANMSDISSIHLTEKSSKSSKKGGIFGMFESSSSEEESDTEVVPEKEKDISQLHHKKAANALSDTYFGPGYRRLNKKEQWGNNYQLEANPMVIYNYNKFRFEPVDKKTGKPLPFKHDSPLTEKEESDILSCYRLMDYNASGYLNRRQTLVVCKLCGLGLSVSKVFPFLDLENKGQVTELAMISFCRRMNLRMKVSLVFLEFLLEEFEMFDVNREGTISAPQARSIIHIALKKMGTSIWDVHRKEDRDKGLIRKAPKKLKPPPPPPTEEEVQEKEDAKRRPWYYMGIEKSEEQIKAEEDVDKIESSSSEEEDFYMFDGETPLDEIKLQVPMDMDSVDLTELYNLVAEAWYVHVEDFANPDRFDLNMRTKWYVDRNQSKNLMDFVRSSHVSLFVEISPFVYENKGQIQFFWRDQSNIHIVNFLVRPADHHAHGDKDYKGKEHRKQGEEQVKWDPKADVLIKLAVYNLDNDATQESAVLKEVEFRDMRDQIRAAIDNGTPDFLIKEYLQGLTDIISRDNVEAWMTHVIDNSMKLAYFNTLFDLLDYVDSSELSFSSFVVFTKLLGLPYHKTALDDMLKDMKADSTCMLSRTQLFSILMGKQTVTLPMVILWGTRNIFQQLDLGDPRVPALERTVMVQDLVLIVQHLYSDWKWLGKDMLAEVSKEFIVSRIYQVTLHELLWAIVDKVGTDASITDIQDLFHMIDTDSKGFITRVEVKLLLKAIQLEEYKIDLSVRQIMKGNSTIDWVEFARAFRLQEDQGEYWPWGLLNLKRAFQNVDADGTGSIDTTEFVILLKKFGLPVSDEEGAKYLAIIDTDDSGEVSFVEFLESLAEDKFMGTPLAEALSLENLANLSAFLANQSIEELEKMMNVENLPFLEKTAVKVAIAESASKEELRIELGLTKQKNDTVQGSGAHKMDDYMRKQILFFGRITIAMAFAVSIVTGGIGTLFETVSEVYQTDNQFDLTSTRNWIFLSIQYLPGIIASIAEILMLYQIFLVNSMKVTDTFGLKIMPLSPQRAFLLTAIVRETLELGHPTDIVFGIDPLLLKSDYIRLMYKVFSVFKGGVTKFVIKTVIKRVVSRSAAKSVLPQFAVVVVALWNVLLARKVMNNVRVVLLGQKAILDILHNILIDDYVTRLSSIKDTALTGDESEDDEDDDDEDDDVKPTKDNAPGVQRMTGHFDENAKGTMAQQKRRTPKEIRINRMNGEWQRSKNNLEGLPLITRTACIQAVAVAITLRQELHPNLELILRELMFYLKVNPETIEDISVPDVFLSKVPKRPYSIGNLDTTSKFLVLRIFALCLLADADLSINESIIMRKLLMAANFKPDVSAFKQVFEEVSNLRQESTMFVDLFAGQDRGVKDFGDADDVPLKDKVMNLLSNILGFLSC